MLAPSIDARWFAGTPTGVRETLATADPSLDAALVESDAGVAYLVVAHDGRDATATDVGRAVLFHEMTSGSLGTPTSTRPLGVEQTNSSFVVTLDDPAAPEVLVKVIRRQDGGTNPDLEVPEALAEIGSEVVLGPLATWSVGGHDLAVALPFLADAEDAWAVALRTEDPTVLARELAATLAELHLDLADAFGTTAAPDDEHAQAVRRACGALERPVDRQLEAAAEGMVDPGVLLRTHGDLHLGQILRSEGRWLVIDFEGEPDRPLAERVRPASPLRDLAGMVRSFAYAEAVAGHPKGWAEKATDHLLMTYLFDPRLAGLLPSDLDAALAAHVLEKAAYELSYERSHRPDWAWIPEAAIVGMVGS